MVYRIGISNILPDGQGWAQLEFPGGIEKVKHVAIAQNGLWIISEEGNVRYGRLYRDDTTGRAEVSLIPNIGEKKMSKIVSDSYGNIWGLTPDNSVHVRKGISFTNPTGKSWKLVAGVKGTNIFPSHFGVFVKMIDGRLIQSLCKYLLSS